MTNELTPQDQEPNLISGILLRSEIDREELYNGFLRLDPKDLATTHDQLIAKRLALVADRESTDFINKAVLAARAAIIFKGEQGGQEGPN
jgi:hypothetical protein